MPNLQHGRSGEIEQILALELTNSYGPPLYS
jgi:hypothetical protein